MPLPAICLGRSAQNCTHAQTHITVCLPCVWAGGTGVVLSRFGLELCADKHCSEYAVNQDRKQCVHELDEGLHVILQDACVVACLQHGAISPQGHSLNTVENEKIDVAAVMSCDLASSSVFMQKGPLQTDLAILPTELLHSMGEKLTRGVCW